MFPTNIVLAEDVISPGAGGLGPIAEFAAPPIEASNARWGVGAGATQITRPNYAVAFQANAPSVGWPNPLFVVQISQFFPTGWSAHEIHEEVLEAIGQLLGHL
jgi:hypothetical protein